MKLIKSFTFLLFGMLMFFGVQAQNTPSVPLKTLENKPVDINDYIGKGNPVFIGFWATWCGPCQVELDAYNDVYEEWKEMYGLEVIAITLDNARGLSKIPGIVASKGWDFIVLSDVNSDMKTALNFQAIPQSYLLDGDGNVIYAHSGYSPGGEYEVEDLLKKLKK